MLDLQRLRLLHELHARGTIAAVADALQFTPSAVSQQLAVLEREAGVPLLEKAGRGVRLTDPALRRGPAGRADAARARHRALTAPPAQASLPRAPRPGAGAGSAGGGGEPRPPSREGRGEDPPPAPPGAGRLTSESLEPFPSHF